MIYAQVEVFVGSWWRVCRFLLWTSLHLSLSL